MRILIVNRCMGIFWGGGETFDYNIAQNLTAMHHKVAILTGKPLFFQKKNIIPNLETNYLSTPYLRKFSYQMMDRIPKVPTLFMLLDLYLFERAAFAWIKMHQSDFDVVHILGLTRLAKKTVQKLKKPTILWYPGPPSERWDMRDLREMNDSRLLKLFSHGDAVSFLRNRNIEVDNIVPGVQTNFFRKTDIEIRKNYGISKDEILLLSCARLIPDKGFDFLIDGFKLAYENFPKLKLMILGDGPYKANLEKKAESLNLKEQIILTGRIENKDISDYYSSADIFLLLSRYENLSNAVLEAMSCELPVIATNVGGISLQIEDGVNGFLVNYQDRDNLCKKILYLAANFDARQKIGKTNRNKVSRDYSWEKSTGRLLGLYHQVLSNKRNKVIFIIPNLGKGGSERVLTNILENLDKDKLEPVCIFYDSKHVYAVPNYVRIYHLNLSGTASTFHKVLRYLWRILKIIRIIKKEKPDVIFSFINRINLTVIISKILSRQQVKLIVSERNTPSFQLGGRFNYFLRIMIKILYPKADKIIAVSRGVEKDLVENFFIPKNKIKVIYNPLDISRIQKLAKENITEHIWFSESCIPIVLNVGSLTEKKGQQYLLRAFRLVLEKIKSRLVILGEGEEEGCLKDLTRILDIQNYVTFLGFQQNPYKFMAKSSLIVLSSLWEGFPNVIIEAMACGIPVVSTDCSSGPNEIIESGITGILVPPRDEKKLAEAIIKILTDRKIAKNISLNSLKNIDRFSVHDIMAEYSGILIAN